MKGWVMKKLASLLFLSCLTWSFAALATTVLPLDLKTIDQQAERVFVGDVISVASDLDEYQIPATFVRLQVLEGIRGVRTGDQILIKQYRGGSRIDGSDGSVLIFPKTLRQSPLFFQEGERLVLFLYPESRYGFTSPVGFGQGAFSIEREGTREVVRNVWGNSFFKWGLSEQTMRALSLPQGGPIDLETFLQVVRRLP